jgi:UDP-N-acetylglucosamine 1-carboxyvinyltransferase
VHHIDRGYPRFERILSELGADVIRETDDDPWPD